MNLLKRLKKWLKVDENEPIGNVDEQLYRRSMRGILRRWNNG